MATAGCGGQGSDASPHAPASSRRLRALWLWPALSQGAGAVGARAQHEAGLRGPGPICRPASLRRGPGSPVCSAGGRRVVASKRLSPDVSTRPPWTELLVHLASPAGSQAERSHLPGCHSGGQTRSTRTDGQQFTQGHSPLATSPSSLAPGLPRQQGSRASSRSPALAQTAVDWIQEAGGSPLPGSARHLPGSLAGPRLGSHMLGLEAGVEPKGPPVPLLRSGCLLPTQLASSSALQAMLRL